MPTTRARTKISPEQAARAALLELRDALKAAGITLPSLELDVASPALGLIQLGRVNVDTARKLAAAIKRGQRHEN